jgi:hypothetical protein
MHQTCFRHDMAEKIAELAFNDTHSLNALIFSDDTQIFLLIQEI